MKKAIIAILLATLTLAACTKEDTKKWIDGTSWKYSYRNNEGFKEECYLSLRNNGGQASYYSGFPPSYGYAYTDLRYSVKSYTYDGDKIIVSVRPKCGMANLSDLFNLKTAWGADGIEIMTTDNPVTRKIKEFMVMYGITDIKMRMLKVSELKAIMGFPPDYVLVGTQGEQKKFIGNAVEVNQSRVLCEALAQRLTETQLL